MEWIVDQAMAKERERRYASVSEFAADLRRYLRGEAVLAGPETASYRLRKFVGRNRVAVSAALFIGVALLTFSILVSVLWRRASHAEGLARERLVRVEAEARTNREVADYISKVLGALDPYSQGRSVRVEDILDRAARDLDRVYADKPALSVALQSRIGLMYATIGRPVKGKPLLEKALQLADLHLEPDDESRLKVLSSLGSLLIRTGELVRAEKLLREALERRLEGLGEDHEETMQSRYGLGNLYLRTGRANEAVEQLSKARELAERLRGVESAEATSYTSGLALALQDQGSKNAQEVAELAVERGKKHLGLDHPATQTALNNFAKILVEGGKQAQAPRLVKDLVVGASGISPTFVTSAGGKVYFADGLRKKLYVSDGSASGTKLLKSFTVVSFLVEAPDRVFVFAGRELWASQGTVASTTLLRRFSRDFRRNDYMHVTILGKQIFFPAYDGSSGIELWKSDGSSGGTQLVKDVRASGSGNPQWLFSDGRRVWFRADDGKAGQELWASDGTSRGTLLVKDINSGRFGSSPYGFARLGDAVVFSASDGSAGIEPWISDRKGTRMIKDLSSCGRSLRPSGFTEMDGLVYFTTAVGAALWATDGSSAGTRKIKSLSGTPMGNPVAAGHRLFFRTGFTKLFWVSDGTAAGTKIFLGMDTSSDFLPLGDGRVAFMSYFRAPTGSELWVTDGTRNGTKAFEVRKGTVSAAASWPARLGNQVFFSATDGKSGQELWVMDTLAVGRGLGGGCAKARIFATPPVLGGSMQFDLRGLVQNKIGVLVLGPVIPVGLPFGSCRIFADFSKGILLPYLPTTTSYRSQLPIPNNSAFAGLRFAVQNWQLGTGPGGLALGDGIELRAGF